MSQRDAAFGWLIEAGYAVEDGGLACAVGADNGGNLAAARGEGELVDGGEAAKAHGQMLDAQELIAAHQPRPSLTKLDATVRTSLSEADGVRRAISPRGRKIITSTMRQSENQHAVVLQLAETLRAANEGNGGDHDAELAAKPAQHHNREHKRRLCEGERLWADEPLPRREERAGETAEHGADGERGEFRGHRIDAERAARDLVLPERLPGAPNGQPPQPQRDEIGEEGQHQNNVIEENEPVVGVVVESRRSYGSSDCPCARRAGQKRWGAGCG